MIVRILEPKGVEYRYMYIPYGAVPIGAVPYDISIYMYDMRYNQEQGAKSKSPLSTDFSIYLLTYFVVYIEHRRRSGLPVLLVETEDFTVQYNTSRTATSELTCIAAS